MTGANFERLMLFRTYCSRTLALPVVFNSPRLLSACGTTMQNPLRASVLKKLLCSFLCLCGISIGPTRYSHSTQRFHFLMGLTAVVTSNL